MTIALGSDCIPLSVQMVVNVACAAQLLAEMLQITGKRAIFIRISSRRMSVVDLDHWKGTDFQQTQPMEIEV
jgi:hypothetical protein